MQEYVASKGLSSGPPPAQWHGIQTKAGEPGRKLNMGILLCLRQGALAVLLSSPTPQLSHKLSVSSCPGDVSEGSREEPAEQGALWG